MTATCSTCGGTGRSWWRGRLRCRCGHTWIEVITNPKGAAVEHRDIDIVQALRDWNTGVPLAEIAAKHGVPAATMHRRIIYAGGTPRQSGRGRPRADIDLDQLAASYRDGLTMRQLAEHYGVATSTIRERLVEAGIQRRPRGATTGSASRKWEDLVTFGRPKP